MADGRGRWYRWDTKATTDDYLDLRIDFVRKRYGLDRIWKASVQWNRGTCQIGEIGIAIIPEKGVILSYKHNGTPVDTLVRFAYTEQHLGGKRAWWLCPACGRRCGILYGGRLFLCRLCRRLPYPVQMTGRPLLETIENRIYRLRRRMKATDRNITTGPPTRKPHYMHLRTYNRLCKDWEALLRLREHCLLIEVYGMTDALKEIYNLSSPASPFSMDDLHADMKERWQAYKADAETP